ncbi:MAG: hypoxanthine phosphoribosyltransferase [Chloroflexi bacterium]|nr:hypoxanthine phosphoribosyltransferase [Chloroflexota bacterium]
MRLDDDVAEVLIGAERLQARVAELGRQIARDYAGLDPIFVCVLKGAILFLTDLMRQVDEHIEIDFMAISSYGGRRIESTGVVRILMDLAASIEGRHVLIVEDIIDTGRTLTYILENLRTRHPASLKVCTLLDKPERRQMDVPLAYVGFQIPDKVVIGYGLDFDEHYRNVPYIGVLKPEKYL